MLATASAALTPAVGGYRAGLTNLEAYGGAAMGAGVLSLVAGIATMQFFLADFDNGFIRNMLQGRRARAAYAGAVLVAGAAVPAALLAVAACAVELEAVPQGVQLVRADVPTTAAWLGAALLMATACVYVALPLAFATRSLTLGILCELAIGSGGLGWLICMWVAPTGVLGAGASVGSGAGSSVGEVLAANMVTGVSGFLRAELLPEAAGAAWMGVVAVVSAALFVLVMRRRALP